MKILFIGPLPPPINGHSLVCKVLHDSLSEKNTLATVDLKKQGLKDGKVSPTRIFEIFRVFIETWKKKKNADVVYFTISESLAGNLKDILIYIICYSILSKFFIHLHGGSIKKLLFDKYPILFSINRFFIKKIGGIIISGRSHLEIFDAYFSLERISIIPNFAPNYMFLSESGFRKKFDDKTKKIRLLFLSNMISQKGYLILLESFKNLDLETKSNFELSFAGRFDSKFESDAFLKEIENEPNILYHGVVSDERKRELFHESQVFILPTMFFEGQPVSILEAYASGCVVVTTGQSGILDIFKDKINGFQINPGSIESIKEILKVIGNRKNFLELKKIAFDNLTLASKDYREETYTKRIKDALGVE